MTMLPRGRAALLKLEQQWGHADRNQTSDAPVALAHKVHEHDWISASQHKQLLQPRHHTHNPLRRTPTPLDPSLALSHDSNPNPASPTPATTVATTVLVPPQPDRLDRPQPQGPRQARHLADPVSSQRAAHAELKHASPARRVQLVTAEHAEYADHALHRAERKAKPFPAITTGLHRPHSPTSLDVPVSASSEVSYWSDSPSPSPDSSQDQLRSHSHSVDARDARSARAIPAALAVTGPPSVCAQDPSPSAQGPSGSTSLAAFSSCCPPDSSLDRPKPSTPAGAGELKASRPSTPRQQPPSSSSFSAPTTPTSTTPSTPPTPARPRRRLSISRSFNNLREQFRGRQRSRSFGEHTEQDHSPASLLPPAPPVPRVPSVYLDLATPALTKRELDRNTGSMSLLRKMTKKRDAREAPKVEAPASVRNVLAEMGAQSEQLRRRPTIPTQHQQPPSAYHQQQNASQQSQLKHQPSIRSADARNVLKQMGNASDQIRARPPGSHPGRPGPRSRPRPKRQGTFEAIVVGQLPSNSDDEADAPTHPNAMAKLSGMEGMPIRHPPSPGTDSSSAPESTPPEVSVLGLELDPNALRKPLALDPTALRQPALYSDEEEFSGLAYDAPVAEKIVLAAPAPNYGSSPSEYGGEDLIDSYFDRSPELKAAKPAIIPSVAPGQIMPGQVMPGQLMRKTSVDAITQPMAALHTHDVVEHHTRAFLANRGMAPDSDDGHSSTDHAAVRPYGSESGHSSQQSHMRRAYGSDLGHGSASHTSHAASVQSHGSVRRARPEHKQVSGTRSRSSSRARETRERRDSDAREKEQGQPGLFRKASQLGRKLSTKHARKKSRDLAPPLPPTSYDSMATRQAEAMMERKSCKPTIHTSSSIAAEIRQVRNKDDAAQMEALFLV